MANEDLFALLSGEDPVDTSLTTSFRPSVLSRTPWQPPVMADPNALARDEAAARARMAQIMSRMDTAGPSEEDKGFAIMRAAAGMAGAGGVGLIGALGKGVGAGLDAYEDADKRAKAHAARLIEQELAGEKFVSDDVTRRERIRSDRHTSAREDARFGHQQETDWATQDINRRREDRADAQHQADYGPNGFKYREAASKEAYNSMMSNYYQSLAEKGYSDVIGYQERDGKKYPVLLNRNSGDTTVGAEPVDVIGKGASGKPSVFREKYEIGMRIFGDDETQAALFAAGKLDKPIAPDRMEQVASSAAARKVATILNPTEHPEAYQAEYERVMKAMRDHNASLATTGAAAPGETPKPRGALQNLLTPGTPVQRPEGVPPGAQYSPSRNQWRWKDEGGNWVVK